MFPLDLHAQFLRPAGPGRTAGRGRIVHRDDEVCFPADELLAPDGTRIAVATATARVRTVPARPRP